MRWVLRQPLGLLWHACRPGEVEVDDAKYHNHTTTTADLQLRKMAAAVTAPPRRRPRRPRPRRTRRRPPRRPRRSAAAWPPRFPAPPRSHHSRAAPHMYCTTPLLTRGRCFLMLVAIPQAHIARASVLLIVAPSRKRAPRARRRAIAVCARAVAGTYTTHPHTRAVMTPRRLCQFRRSSANRAPIWRRSSADRAPIKRRSGADRADRALSLWFRALSLWFRALSLWFRALSLRSRAPIAAVSLSIAVV